jgi:hypothetical protein
MIREIHRNLVEGVRGGSAAPGEYRRIQNYVVNAGTGQVIYTPPTAVEMPVMMSELVKWLNGDLDIHPVLVSGIAQFQLVHIHPFLDGNGRASRLLSTLCLYKAGYDFKRLFTISEYYDHDRPTFYKSIQSLRDNGMDMTGWLDYFVTDRLIGEDFDHPPLDTLVLAMPIPGKGTLLVSQDHQNKPTAPPSIRLRSFCPSALCCGMGVAPHRAHSQFTDIFIATQL